MAVITIRTLRKGKPILHKFILIWLCLLLCNSIPALAFQASDNVPNTTSQKPHRLTQVYYQVTSAELSASDLVANPAYFHNFSALAAGQATIRTTEKQAVWLLLKISNPHHDTWQALFSYHFLPADYVDFYRLDLTLPAAKLLAKTGNALPFPERPYAVSSYSQPLTFNANEQVVMLIKLQDAALLGTELTIAPVPVLLQSVMHSQILDGIIIGIILVLMVLACCHAQQQPAFYALAAFYLTFALLLATMNGMAFNQLWPLYPEINQVMLYISTGTVLFFLCVFNRYSLLKSAKPYALRINRGAALLALILLFSPLFANGPQKLQLLFICVPLVLSINLLQALITSLVSNKPQVARYMLLIVVAALSLLLVQARHLSGLILWLNSALLLLLALSTILLYQRQTTPPPAKIHH